MSGTDNVDLPDLSHEAAPGAAAPALLNNDAAQEAAPKYSAVDLEAVFDVPVTVSAVLGKSAMEVSQLLKLGKGAILELDRKRGAGQFLRIDTINTQRKGTSFAVSDTDYGEKTCVVSQGLGTTSVSFKGKSYWVCCSGCKDLFNENPEAVLAEAAERQKAKEKK